MEWKRGVGEDGGGGDIMSKDNRMQICVFRMKERKIDLILCHNKIRIVCVCVSVCGERDHVDCANFSHIININSSHECEGWMDEGASFNFHCRPKQRR